MNSSWVSNSNSTDRVKALLEQAGVPLELSVASICNEFCDKYKKWEGTGYWTEKVVYSTAQSADEYRELDQKVTIYNEFKVGKSTHIQLQLQMPIECKYRKDLEIFAFPLVDYGSYERFPLHSSMKGSKLFAALVGTLEHLSGLSVCSPVFLEIKNGETPQKVHDENLVYNAAGTLYDFILTDLIPDDNVSAVGLADEIVIQSGLIDEFKKFIDKENYAWFQAVDDWISDIDKKHFDSFNKKYFERFNKHLHMVSAHMPIVCLNAPIHKVNWSVQKGIESFQEIPFFITTIRKRGWPGLASTEILNRNPEVPVIITNPTNLLNVLELGKKWHDELEGVLSNAPEPLIYRWALESNVYLRIFHDFQKSDEQNGYRSDYDFKV